MLGGNHSFKSNAKIEIKKTLNKHEGTPECKKSFTTLKYSL